MGTHVTVYTNHRPLVHLKQQPILSPRQYRWLTYFSDFDTEIIVVEGTRNVVADALSRYAFDSAFTRNVDRLRVTFLKNTLASPGIMSSIYDLSGYTKLSSVHPSTLFTQFASTEDSAAVHSSAGGEDDKPNNKKVDIIKSLLDSYSTDEMAISVKNKNPA